jgi:hypothetical protein
MANLHPIIETMERSWMRAWVAGDSRALKALTARNFRMVVASKPSVILDYKSWLDAASTRYQCSSYRFGDIYVRSVGGMAIFAAPLELKARMDGEDWSGAFWVTDLWRKGKVRRGWKMVQRVVARADDNPALPKAIRALQLWK